METVDQSLENRRIVRDQETRLAATANIAISSVRPFIEFQISTLRFWSDHCELLARNVEKNFEGLIGQTTEQSLHHQ